MALVDDIADLLAVHNEVNAICGQCQKGVVDMVQLKRRKEIFSNTSTFLKTFLSACSTEFSL